MPYESQLLVDFGAGMNLTSKADAVGPGEAIDALNVIFTDRGAVQQRDGTVALGSALTNAVGSLHPFYTTGGTKQLLAGCGTRLEALSTTGTVVASATGLTSGVWDFARFGAPNSEVAYAGNGQNLLRKWDGSAWSSIANSPKAGSLAVSAESNRLVCSRFLTTTGGPSAGTSSPSHVFFSDAGLPESYTANNYVQLTPGDGEQIQAVIAWREFIFAFKESKFFVFYGESTDSSGNPIFDYRIVDTGVGLCAPRAVVATESGVYFADRRGVFVTTGEAPAKVSGAIDPIFLGGSEAYFTGGEMDQAALSSLAMGVHEDRIYLGYSTNGSTNDRTLVYDYDDGWWSLWDTPATCFAEFRPSSRDEMVFGSSAANTVHRHYGGLTADDSTAISSRWRSGFYDFGLPENKTVRQTKLWGSGKLFYGLSHDYTSAGGPFDAVDFTSADQINWNAENWNTQTWENPTALFVRVSRRSSRGTVFSLMFQNEILNQPWAIHRAEPHLRGVRQPTTRKTDN